jgi:DNA-binding CsgD family transcriptional regulator
MRYDEALKSGLELIELNKRVHDLRSEVSAHYFVVTCLIENGDLEAAKSHAFEMLSQAERLGDRF